ncbi:MAG: insulinase family protein [Deltaproteobacteria bacterium]|nr:insulinase family protein [Deltaproteobacteria bacterium]
MRARLLAALFVVTAAACGGTPPAPVATPTPPPPPIATPPARPAVLVDLPPPGAPKPLKPAEVFTLTTKAGVKTIGIASHELPIVHCRVVVRAGNAAVAALPNGNARAGLANVVAELLKDGGAGRFAPRELAERVDSLGADLSVEVGPDRAVFGLSVTRDKLDAALEILGAVVGKPRFDAGEFAKLKARELDRVRQSQKGSGSWMARSAMYRELFGAGHPYAEIDANDESLSAMTLADAKAFWSKLYVAANVTVVVAGDVDAKDLGDRLDKHLALSNKAPPTIPWTDPKASSGVRVVLAKKAGSKQADILLGLLSLPRSDARWPELALAVHALGGGMSSRLFVDVREKRSLAYSTTAMTRELAHGPSVVALYAGTQTPLAPKSAAALLEHLAGIRAAHPIEDGELAIARTSLETGFLFRLETLGAVAGVAIDQAVLGLPGKDVYDYVAGYRAALRGAPIDAVRSVTSGALAAGAVLSVAGDPALAKSLRRFGPVRVVDPEKAFSTIEELPHDPNAALEVELPNVPVAK